MPHLPTRRDCLSLLALPALSAALLPGRAQAQALAPAYTQPLRIVLPFAPGGPTDMMARAISKSMSQTLGQPVVVDNKPGAAGWLPSRRCNGHRPTATRWPSPPSWR